MTPIGRLAVIGVGLIGGSFALALRRRALARAVVGVGRSEANLRTAIASGVIDATCDLEEAVAGADFVLLATPVGQMEEALARMRTVLDPSAVITDAGSTKARVVAAARRALGARVAQFVPGHPVAGAERSGAEAATADLFAGRRVVLSPLAENSAETVDRVRSAWEACGASVHEMTPEQHDDLLAVVSHLPHAIAYAFMRLVSEDPNAPALLANAGSGFRDFTRLAGGHPEMWADILLDNRTALLDALDRFGGSVSRLRTLIEQGRAGELRAMLDDARGARTRWMEQFERGRGA